MMLGENFRLIPVLLWKQFFMQNALVVTGLILVGLSEDTPKGIAEFKKGLNATPYRLIRDWLSHQN